MKKVSITILGLLGLLLFASLAWKNEGGITRRTTVAEMLVSLGEPEAPHLPRADVTGVSAERGKEIVLFGRTESPAGGRSERVSKHFVCTSCHNVERDEPILAVSDPEARLAFAAKKGLPFLQGSSLYGVVDRRLFYNGDYENKYGELVKPARNDLRQAIHLCVTECAQGRPLADWEMESVLAYLWTIGLQMDDLGLSANDLGKIEKAVYGKAARQEAVDLVKSKFQLSMPATFLAPPADRQAGASKQGDPARGKQIYELSCLHCHGQQRYSFFNLDHTGMTFRFLEKHFPTYSRYSVYQVARYGTPPVPWKRAYMPHYTKEKMSEQMLEDLRVYVEEQAK